MGTRSVTKFYQVREGEREFLGSIYRQYDGYPDGHGLDLQKFLKGKKVTNGYSPEQVNGMWFNGIGCLAASVIKHLKDGIGGIYLDGQEGSCKEFNYDLYDDGERIMVKCYRSKWEEHKEVPGELVYEGAIDDWDIPKGG